MKEAEYYRGREQTYLKHFFLERYLEKVAYIIGYTTSEFIYVDGFSGPWRAEDEDYGDTSFMIAIQKLRTVKHGLAARGKRPRIRCLFIERDPQRYQQLQQVTQNIKDIEVHTLNGDLESSIPKILEIVGGAFALFFIDPTGWTGIGLQQIASILRHHPGEVMINFMFDFINRFLEHPGERTTETFNELFGGPGWEQAVEPGERREDTIVELYCRRVKSIGKFTYVTFTRILKPTTDRSYFYLIYGTRHPKGLQEFRKVEKQSMEEQKRIRADAKQQRRIERTGQAELFGSSEVDAPDFLESDKRHRLQAAQGALIKRLQRSQRLDFEDILNLVSQIPLVWPSDIQDIVSSLRDQGRIEVEGMKPRERTVKPGHILIWNNSTEKEP